MSYIEAPTGRIVNCHFKDKKPPPPTDCRNPPLPTPLSNIYGYGARVEFINPDLISAVPYGPLLFPPFVGNDLSVGGVWNTHANNPNDGTQWPNAVTTIVDGQPVTSTSQKDYGGLLHPYVDAEGNQITDTIAAALFGNHAAEIYLDGSQMTLTDAQLAFLVNQFDPPPFVGWEFWTVPMAIGSVCQNFPQQQYDPITNTFKSVDVYLPIPWVIKSYQIDVAWQSFAYPDIPDEVGIGFSHPLTAGGPVTAPPEPQFIIGPRQPGGTASITYDFKYKEWSRGVIFDETNQFDLSTGGPVFVWWMTRRGGGAFGFTDWVGSQQFMAPIMFGATDPPDWYTWQITATGQPEPSPF
jgi:hypothetical protein